MTRRVHCRKPGAAVVILSFACLTLEGCSFLREAYEKELFATVSMRVINSDQHCKDGTGSSSLEVANVDLVTTRVDGLGRLVATDIAWEVRARQLATELDGNIAVIKPCAGKGRAFEFRQIEIWRTHGYMPTIHEGPPTPGVTFSSPDGASYGVRLNDIYACLEKGQTATDNLSASEQARLPEVNATEFFSSGRHFAGYAKIDRYYRPTRAEQPSFSKPTLPDVPSLAMTLSRRSDADYAASNYQSSTPQGQKLLAEHYLNCLLNRGYRLQAN